MVETFDAAIYTNCAPGEGLDGIAGMQFQSRTPGMSWDLLTLVRRHLLYEPPAILMQEHRPVSEFPPSLAHIFDESEGVFATASGRYRGQEAVGRREGNHLTHAVAATSQDAYGVIRPAQLSGASFWQRQPHGTLDLEAPPFDWEPGPIGAAEAAETVRLHPSGHSMLAALVTVLKQPDLAGRRRVVLRTASADAAVHWLTAATLLLPQQQALRVSFKIFSMDPARSALKVVAVHPVWSTFTASVDHDLGYAIFDLDEGRWTPLPADSEAERWAELFCGEEAEAVAEAVDLAEASTIRDPASARALAVAATLGHPPDRSTASSLLTWLENGPEAVVETYGGLVVDVLAQRADPATLTRLEAITRTVDLGRRHDTVRLAILRSQLAKARDRPHLALRAAGDVPPLPARAEPAARELAIDALQSARGEAFAAVLTVASRWGVTVPFADIPEEINAFLADWLNNPGAPYPSVGWRTDPPVLVRLEEEVRGIARDGSKSTVLAANWWRQLRQKPFVANVDDEFDAAMLTAAVQEGGRSHRLGLITMNLEDAVRRSADTEHLAKVLTALFGHASPTTEELQAVARLTPEGTRLEERLTAELATDVVTAYPVPRAKLELSETLIARRLVPDTEQWAPVRRLIEANKQLMTYLREPFETRHPPLDWLRKLPPQLLSMHAEVFAARMRLLEDLVLLDRLVRILPPPVLERYLADQSIDQTRWTARRTAVAYFLLTCFRPGSAPHLWAADRLDNPLRKWVETHAAADIDAVAQCLRSFNPQLAEAWRQMAGRGGRRPGIVERIRGRFS